MIDGEWTAKGTEIPRKCGGETFSSRGHELCELGIRMMSFIQCCCTLRKQAIGTVRYLRLPVATPADVHFKELSCSFILCLKIGPQKYRRGNSRELAICRHDGRSSVVARGWLGRISWQIFGCDLLSSSSFILLAVMDYFLYAGERYGLA